MNLHGTFKLLRSWRRINRFVQLVLFTFFVSYHVDKVCTICQQKNKFQEIKRSGITKLWRWTTVLYSRSHIIRRYNFTKSRYWDAAHPSTLDTQMRSLWWMALGCWRGDGTSCRCISQQLLQNWCIFSYPKSVCVYLYIFFSTAKHIALEKQKKLLRQFK